MAADDNSINDALTVSPGGEGALGCIYFNSGNYRMSDNRRYHGRSVRPVQGFAK